MIRSYSSRVNPWARARSGVTFGGGGAGGSARTTGTPSPRASATQDRPVLDEATQQRVEQQEAVRAPHAGLRGALRVGHQADHGPLLVAHAGDAPHRAVR